MGADNTEKQGHSAFPSRLPFCHLASTKGCYVTAIYTRTPFPSHPPSHVRQHHMQTKWNCSSALLQVLFLLFLCLFLLSSNQPPLSLFHHLKESLSTPLFCFCFFAVPVKRTCNARVLEGNRTACHVVTRQMADE